MPPIFSIYGFEGKGGKYLVMETQSASEARDLSHARICSGFRTVVYSADAEVSADELERLAEIEDRLR